MTRHLGRAASLGVLAFLVSSCMPWLAGGRSAPLPPGGSQFSIGVTALMPPSFDDVLPVPHASYRKSVGSRTDIAIEYAAPATLSLSGAHWWRTGEFDVGGIAGAGVLTVPEILDMRATPVFPFLQMGLVASRPSKRREFASLRAFAPISADGDLAATVWLVVSSGADFNLGPLRIAPEIGAVLQATRAHDVLVLGGMTMRRGRRK